MLRMGSMRMYARLSIAALAFGACGHKSLRTAADGPPHSAPVYYVAPAPFKTARFAPPPVPDSDEQKADFSALRTWQDTRTEADCLKSSRTAAQTYDSFWGTRSPFPEPLPAEVKGFFERLASDLEAAVSAMKSRWSRPRPYAAYPQDLRPCIPRSRSTSYPSGHAAFSRVFADVLADIVPERAAEFRAKADEIALDRVIGGVHYPTDIAAGKVFGDLYHAALLGSDAYRRDVEKLKSLRVD